jgi:iron complex transport system ATP-binding protein
MRVDLAGVRVTIDGIAIVSGIDLIADPGEFIGIVGPNGSGKSTLLRTLYRAVQPSAGVVSVGGDDLWRTLSAKASARRVAAVPQDSSTEFDLSVTEMVFMGRAPHQRAFALDTRQDRDIVQASLARVGMAESAHRRFSTLSGGEKQRVLLARALAQRSRALILDEPTNHLDVAAQLELLELIRELRITTIAAIHELNLAAAYCDRVYVLSHGKVVAAGPVFEVLTTELVAEVFGVYAYCDIHPLTGLPHFYFAPLSENKFSRPTLRVPEH